MKINKLQRYFCTNSNKICLIKKSSMSIYHLLMNYVIPNQIVCYSSLLKFNFTLQVQKSTFQYSNLKTGCSFFIFRSSPSHRSINYSITYITTVPYHNTSFCIQTIKSYFTPQVQKSTFQYSNLKTERSVLIFRLSYHKIQCKYGVYDTSDSKFAFYALGAKIQFSSQHMPAICFCKTFASSFLFFVVYVVFVRTPGQLRNAHINIYI